MLPLPMRRRSTRRSTVRRGATALAVAAIASLAACSSGDDTDPATSGPPGSAPQAGGTSSTPPSSVSAAVTSAAPTPTPTTTTVAASTVPASPTSAPGSTGAPPTPPSTVTGTTDVPVTYASVEDEVAARYVAYWDARHAVLSGDALPDPNDPRLAAHAVGNQLAIVTTEVQRYHDEGRRVARPTVPADHQVVTVVSVDGDTAEVQECFVDDGMILDRATGAVLEDGVVTINMLGTMHRVDGAWKLAEVTVIQHWEGVAGCALAG